MKIPINSILIHERFVTLCENWHNGIRCTLYTIASTGGLTVGTHLPVGCDTIEQAYLSAWRDLAYDAGRTVRIRGNNNYETLAEFEEWVDSMVDRLEESYGLADWDRSFC